MSKSDKKSVEERNAERRQLRREQTALHEELVSKRDQLTSEVGPDLLSHFRDINNEQFER